MTTPNARSASGYYTVEWDKPELAYALVCQLLEVDGRVVGGTWREARPSGNARDRRRWRRARMR